MTGNSENIYLHIIYVPDAPHIKVVVKDTINDTIIDSREANAKLAEQSICRLMTF